ncbi:hypothetical protein GQ53DRAFT_779273 [Thozetella sp. PMI_491]|nr:hypothetical protein GQ53DRAFT_779273 [Thozetella sp. PMI_491]
MAAPENKTIRDLTGSWKLNKTLSDSPEPTLALQGVPWLIRKAICTSSLTIHVKQYEAPPAPTIDGPAPETDPVVHIDIDSVVSGLKATREERCLDSLYRPHEDWVFGKVKSRNEFVDTATLQGPVKEACGAYSTEGWLDEGEYLVSYVERLDGTWTATQVWGFMKIEGERRHCRKIRVESEGKSAEIKFVHDWVEKTK